MNVQTIRDAVMKQLNEINPGTYLYIIFVIDVLW